MTNLANVIRQLKKERLQAQRRIEQLDEALKAESVCCAERPQDTAVLRRRAQNEGLCPQPHADELLLPSESVGQNGRQHLRASEPIRAAFSTLPFTDISFLRRVLH